MTEAEYRMMLKKQISKIYNVQKCIIYRKDELTIYFLNKNYSKTEIYSYLEKNKDKFKIMYEYEDYMNIKILDIEKYKAPKTELDIKIEKLEEQLKEFKKLRSIERIEQIKENKILKLKEELKKLEEEK